MKDSYYPWFPWTLFNFCSLTDRSILRAKLSTLVVFATFTELSKHSLKDNNTLSTLTIFFFQVKLENVDQRLNRSRMSFVSIPFSLIQLQQTTWNSHLINESYLTCPVCLEGRITTVGTFHTWRQLSGITPQISTVQTLVECVGNVSVVQSTSHISLSGSTSKGLTIYFEYRTGIQRTILRTAPK